MQGSGEKPKLCEIVNWSKTATGPAPQPPPPAPIKTGFRQIWKFWDEILHY